MFITASVTDHKEDSSLRHYKETFSENDVDYAFNYLLQKLESLWSEVDFHSLKRVCIRDIRISDDPDLKRSINGANDLEKIFDLLSKTPFCTWLEIRILKRMAKTVKIPEATQIIQIFEDCVYNKKCSEVISKSNEKYIHSNHLKFVTLKVNKIAEKWNIAQLIEYCHNLDNIFNLSTDSITPTEYQDGCLEICIVIPNYCSLHAYKVAQSSFFKFRYINIQYLQIGTFPKIYIANVNETENAKFILERVSSIAKCMLLINY